MLRQFQRDHIPCMPIFVFRSEKDRRQLAFATDEEGKALPAQLGPWCRTSNRAVPTFVGMPDSFQAAVAVLGHVLIQNWA
jgi:hypothetical protein